MRGGAWPLKSKFNGNCGFASSKQDCADMWHPFLGDFGLQTEESFAMNDSSQNSRLSIHPGMIATLMTSGVPQRRLPGV
jgi:hypothetical protein